MSIRNKVFVLIAALFLVLGGVNLAIQWRVTYASFVDLEQREAEENLRRIFFAIDRELAYLDELCMDWAAWDDSYAFMQDRSEDFIAGNLNSEAQKSNRLAVLAYVDPDGRVVWERSLAPGTQAVRRIDFLARGRVAEGHPVLSRDIRLHAGGHGTCATEFGPMLFATRPVLRSDESGPSNGFLIMGRVLDQQTVDVLREQTRIDFSVIYPLRGGVARQESGVVMEQGGGRFRVTAEYRDAFQRSVFGVEYCVPREITRKGLDNLRIAVGMMVGSGVAVLLMLNVLLQAVVLRPIQRLTRHVTQLEQDGDHTARLNMARRDEIGSLAHGIDSMVRTIRERTEALKLANEQLSELARIDALTGIPNRREFDACLQQEWRRALREGTPLSVIMLDVDYFKNFNDAYGHQRGDTCLVQIATVLAGQIRRPADLAARYGGEEFVVILPNTHAAGAMFMAERIRLAVEGLHIVHEHSPAGPVVTVSLGVMTEVPSSAEVTEMEQLLKKADEALYAAKRHGRNQVVFAADHKASD